MMPLKTCKSSILRDGYISWDHDLSEQSYGVWLRTFAADGTLVQGAPSMAYFKKVK